MNKIILFALLLGSIFAQDLNNPIAFSYGLNPISLHPLDIAIRERNAKASKNRKPIEHVGRGTGHQCREVVVAKEAVQIPAIQEKHVDFKRKEYNPACFCNECDDKNIAISMLITFLLFGCYGLYKWASKKKS